MAEMKVTIDGIGLFEKTAEVFKDMLEDVRINEAVRNEYRARVVESIDKWAATKITDQTKH